jgi:4-carboxymuconolactone decarboxylase
LFGIGLYQTNIRARRNKVADNLKELTKKVAALYFDGLEGERAYDIWQSFDSGFARDLSLFITGQLYARERIPHKIRQLVTVAALTVLERTEELKVHIHAGLNVGCTPIELAEVIFQMSTYGGVPVMNTALKALRDVLQERKAWPISKRE